MNDILIIATLIERLPHGELKSMANLLCDSMKEFPKNTKWANEPDQIADMLYDWAVVQTEAAAEE